MPYLETAGTDQKHIASESGVSAYRSGSCLQPRRLSLDSSAWLRPQLVMAQATIAGTEWTAIENDLIVASYFAMLDEEIVGRPYVKAHQNAEIVKLTGRTRGSVERKYMNISAVLMELGMQRIRGYAPNANAQFDALTAAIERFLAARPDVLTIAPPVRATGIPNDPFVDPPGLSPKSPPAAIQRLARKFDPVERDARNRELGKQGEAFVLECEERRLHALERQDLARRVRWVSDLDGDGAGYDILSYDPDSGDQRLIEVKTTCGPVRTPFFLTRNEESLARETPEFRLYRVFDFAHAPHIFVLEPPLAASLHLQAQTWRASFS